MGSHLLCGAGWGVEGVRREKSSTADEGGYEGGGERVDGGRRADGGDKPVQPAPAYHEREVGA